MCFTQRPFWDHLYPCFLTFGDTGFKARLDSLTCTFYHLRLWCNTCWPLGSQHCGTAVSIQHDPHTCTGWTWVQDRVCCLTTCDKTYRLVILLVAIGITSNYRHTWCQQLDNELSCIKHCWRCLRKKTALRISCWCRWLVSANVRSLLLMVCEKSM